MLHVTAIQTSLVAAEPLRETRTSRLVVDAKAG